VRVQFKDSTYRIISYPKFLVEFLLDRALDPKLETIDHIDEDFSNNAWCNLRVIDISTHVSQENTRTQRITQPCAECGVPVTRSPSQLRNRNKLGMAGPFCSNTCKGKYSSARTWKNIAALPTQPYVESVHTKPNKIGGLFVATLPQAQTLTEKDILAFVLETQQHRAQKLTEAKESARRYCTCGGVLKTYQHRWCSRVCADNATRKAERPAQEEMQRLVDTLPATKIGKLFGVSSNTIKKWCKKLGVVKTK
jgi:hypothetical protein